MTKKTAKPKGWMAPRSGGYVPAATAGKKVTSRTKIVPPKGGGGVVVVRRSVEASARGKSA